MEGEILLLHNTELEESFNYFHSHFTPLYLQWQVWIQKRKAFKLVQKAPAEKQSEKLVLEEVLEH